MSSGRIRPLSKVRGDDCHRGSIWQLQSFDPYSQVSLSTNLSDIDLPLLLFSNDGAQSAAIHSNNSMSHNTCIRALLCALAVLFVVSTYVRGGSRRPHGGVIDFPPQIVQLKSGCLWIDGTLASGAFFEGLERKDHDGIFEYRNSGGKRLTDYPQSVVASIRILDDQCVPALSSSRVSLGRKSYSFSFQIAWKTGVQVRPALLSATGVHCTGSPGTGEALMPPMTCQMTVKSGGTPLSDHLIVSVFGSDGARLTRLSTGP